MIERQARNGSESVSLAGHILPVSATMVGVCMTVISLVQIIPKSDVSSWVDALLAVDNMLFLSSALISYYAIRHPGIPASRHRGTGLAPRGYRLHVCFAAYGHRRFYGGV
jgi:hypothetical protein